MTSRLGFGALHLTDGGWGPPVDRDAAKAVLRTAVDLGVHMIDTADAYGVGANEELIAEALHPYPAGLTVATKAGQCRPGRGEWVPLGRPEYLRQQAELSLRRLRVERLDLFYLHRVDPAVPLADQVGALADLRAEGKVDRIGLSEVDVETIEAARRVAPISAVQNKYSVDDRAYEEVVDHCTAESIAFVPWRPIPRGDARVAKVAAELGAPEAAVALAWLLARSPAIQPIPGTTSLEHLRENMSADAITLTADQVAVLDQS
ncbi:aldo/keto reductase [Actinokineospora soli]|uniref:Aldo/keto reductase n=1 Tax=Actinokineospora soli TaxID=1048753 RepID=A0ABW2TU61_9PSEU